MELAALRVQPAIRTHGRLHLFGGDLRCARARPRSAAGGSDRKKFVTAAISGSYKIGNHFALGHFT